MKVLILTFLVTMGLSACYEGAPVNSNDYTISDINMTMVVESKQSNKTSVSVHLARFRQLTTIPVNLTGSDQLIANAYGVTKPLTKVKDGEYQVVFNANTSDVFKISFLRTGERGAPNNTVTLPPPFAITQPVNNQIFNNSDLITFSWSPANNFYNMNLVYEVTCTTISNNKVSFPRQSLKLNDIGSYVFDSSKLSISSFQNLDVTQPCTCNFLINRYEYNGIRDDNLGGGSFGATQEKAVNLLINP